MGKKPMAIRVSPEKQKAMRDLATGAGTTLTAAIEESLPDEEILHGITAAARFGAGIAPETNALLLAGMISRIQAVGLDTVQIHEIERAIHKGDSRAIATAFARLVEAQSNRPESKYSIVRVSGGDGLAIAPRGWTATREGDEIRFEKPRAITLADMLRGLRDADPEVRGAAGYLLALSAGAGLKLTGANQLDFEHGAGNDLAELIRLAVDGDKSAVDTLERVLTNDPNKSARTPSERSPKAAAKEVK